MSRHFVPAAPPTWASWSCLQCSTSCFATCPRNTQMSHFRQATYEQRREPGTSSWTSEIERDCLSPSALLSIMILTTLLLAKHRQKQCVQESRPHQDSDARYSDKQHAKTLCWPCYSHLANDRLLFPAHSLSSSGIRQDSPALWPNGAASSALADRGQ